MCFLLSGMPLDRVVDFSIDLVPDTVSYGTGEVKRVEGEALGTL